MQLQWEMLYVSSQPAMVPSSRSMPSRDKLLPFDTWGSPGITGTLFGNQFSTFDSPRDHPQRIHCGATPPRERETGVSSTSNRDTDLFHKDDEQNRDTIPTPTFAGRPSTMSSPLPVEFPQNSMVGQQRQQISELQFDKFPTSQSFLVWKILFKNQATTCSDFPSDAMLWIKKVEIEEDLFPALWCDHHRERRRHVRHLNCDGEIQSLWIRLW